MLNQDIRSGGNAASEEAIRNSKQGIWPGQQCRKSVIHKTEGKVQGTQ